MVALTSSAQATSSKSQQAEKNPGGRKLSGVFCYLLRTSKKVARFGVTFSANFSVTFSATFGADFSATFSAHVSPNLGADFRATLVDHVALQCAAIYAAWVGIASTQLPITACTSARKAAISSLLRWSTSGL